VFPGFALLSTPPSYQRGCRASAAGVDEGVTDLALARVQIRSVMEGAEVGDLDLACTVVEARVPKCMREGAAGLYLKLL